MTALPHYQPPVAEIWQGRPDAPADSCFFQVMKFTNLQNDLNPATVFPSFALLGFCCDEGIRRNFGRVGAKEGPFALRQALAKLPIHRQDANIFDAGNINCDDGDLEQAQHELAKAVHLLLQNGYTPILIGGGHEIAWGHYQGIALQYPTERIGIVNFDTHFDMRPVLPDEQGSSGTPFLQIANSHEANKRLFDYNCIGIQEYGNSSELFRTAMSHHAHILLADDLQNNHYIQTESFINRVVQDNEYLYVSLCLDVFASGYAPGVSAPQAFGVTPWQVVSLIRQLTASGKVASYDIAELSPPLDIDNRTAKLAANFVYEIVHHHNANHK